MKTAWWTTPSLLAVLLLPAAVVGQTRDDTRFTAWGARELAWIHGTPHFLTRDALLAIPVTPPPSNTDPSTRAELDELLRLQAARTPSEQHAIEHHREFGGLCEAFFALLGRTAASVPRTRALLSHVNADLRVPLFTAKRRFNRARPHQLEPRLHPCIAVPAHASYPSGHATQGYLVAHVLALLVPDARDRLNELGVQIGHEREIAGLHYPSDSAASRVLGEQIFRLLEQNQRFRQELEAARSEWH